MPAEMRRVSFKNGSTGIAADLRLPEGFDGRGSYAALVIATPGSSVKGQSGAVYGRMADRGYVSVTFDPTFQRSGTRDRPVHFRLAGNTLLVVGTDDKVDAQRVLQRRATGVAAQTCASAHGNSINMRWRTAADGRIADLHSASPPLVRAQMASRAAAH